MSKSKWIYKNLKNSEFQTLAEQFNVHPAIIKILADRGIQGEEAVREYLEADISRVSDGSELTDMQRGVDIVYDAVKAGKYIRIMGDYDVDGVSSTYILYKGLDIHVSLPGSLLIFDAGCVVLNCKESPSYKTALV